MSVSSGPIYSVQNENKNCIYLLSWRGGNDAHWALFTPLHRCSPRGKLVHITVDRKRVIRGDAKLKIATFDITRGNVYRSIELRGAEATLLQLREAVQDVFRRFKYNLVTSNCQNFVLRVVKRLNQLYPNSVTTEAIKHIQSRGTLSTSLEILTDRMSSVRHIKHAFASRRSVLSRWKFE